MIDDARWIRLLERTGALQSGHFLLSSGLHSPRYVQCARTLEDPADAAAMGEALAQRLPHSDIDRVVSPPLGALLIGYEVARSLRRPFVFPERTEAGGLSFRRGLRVQSGERIAVVEDVITTGRTTRELIELLRASGAEVVALAAIADRSDVGEIRGLPIVSLVALSIPRYPPDVCPMCAAGVPLVKPGSRPQGEVVG